jgi:K+-sensing histidine kinase KdpD
MLIFEEITDIYLMSIMKNNNDYKSNLLSSVSHELRTPLNSNF